jgi:hypothetical protein
MMQLTGFPEASYGILEQDRIESDEEGCVEQIKRLGYAVLDSGYTPAELHEISDAFNRVRQCYVDFWGEERLKALNEFHTIRALPTQGEPVFIRMALNRKISAVLKALIRGKFILNQQNGIINPPGETYNQAAWHRDLPYQHYVSSSPLAINTLFCVDDFTLENGATYVLPGSHKAQTFPSLSYIRRNALQIEAKAGQYILLDCMLFHCGGFNSTGKERRAVNHVYNIPYFKQQINLPRNMFLQNLPPQEAEIFGAPYPEPSSIEEYLALRAAKTGRGEKNG